MNISDIANFGESGKLALSHAERIAREFCLTDLGTEPLFLGVAQLEDVNIRRQFQKVGVDIDEISRAIRRDIRAGEAAAGHKLMLSSGAKKALEAAKEKPAISVRTRSRRLISCSASSRTNRARWSVL